MATITFDTHKFVRKLTEAGFAEKQAEALTECAAETEKVRDQRTDDAAEKPQNAVPRRQPVLVELRVQFKVRIRFF